MFWYQCTIFREYNMPCLKPVANHKPLFAIFYNMQQAPFVLPEDGKLVPKHVRDMSLISTYCAFSGCNKLSTPIYKMQEMDNFKKTVTNVLKELANSVFCPSSTLKMEEASSSKKLVYTNQTRRRQVQKTGIFTRKKNRTS